MTDFSKLLVAVVASGLAVATLGACGSGELEANQASDQSQNDDGDGDSTDVADADGLHVVVDVAPTRNVYDVDASVTPSASVYDGDQLVEDAEVRWTVDPAEAVERDGDGWVIRRADTVTFEACVLDGEGNPTSDCGNRDIVTSGDDRGVVIETPAPGEHFNGTENDLIPVEGTVGDGLAVSSVHVNGEAAELDGDGGFSHQIEPEFGLNTIVVEAFDGVTSRDYVATTNAFWAPEFRELDTQDGISSSIDQAVLVNLGQNFFDDGESYEQISDSEVVTKDIADMFELLLENLDVTSELPDPVVDNDALTLSVDDIVIEDTSVDIATTEDGIEIFGRITDLKATTDGSLSLSDNTVDLAGEVFATASLMVDLHIEKVGPDAEFDVELDFFELAVEEATPAFEDEEANAIFEVADSMLRSELEGIILDSIDTTFIDNLPDMISEMLGSLEDVMSDESFEIDLDFGEPVNVSFDGDVGKFTPVQGEGLDGAINTETTVDAEPVYPDHPGVAMLAPEIKDSPLFAESRLQIGIDLAMLNTIFYSLWNAGFLDLEITDLVPESVQNLIDEGYAEGLLPPLMVPADEDRNEDLLLQLGQLELDLEWMDQNDRFGVNVEVGADTEIDGDQIAINLADEFDIEVWLIESSEDEPVMTAGEIRDLLETIILPEIESEIGDNLTFDLPMPELDIIESYAADLADMSLNVRMNRSPDIRNGYLMFDATLEGEHFLD